MHIPEETVAAILHDANRRLQIEVGDPAVSQPWEQAADWEREASLDGVRQGRELVAAGLTADQAAVELHDRWRAFKEDRGWVWGEKKDPDAHPPTHPSLVDFGRLSRAEQAKDLLQMGIIAALS